MVSKKHRTLKTDVHEEFANALYKIRAYIMNYGYPTKTSRAYIVHRQAYNTIDKLRNQLDDMSSLEPHNGVRDIYFNGDKGKILKEILNDFCYEDSKKIDIILETRKQILDAVKKQDMVKIKNGLNILENEIIKYKVLGKL